MKERPILFSAPMVRAILDGRKTQTRRIVKAKHLPWLENSVLNFLDGKWNQRPLPYGKPGDRLWVRETWADLRSPGSLSSAAYLADYPFKPSYKFKPSIHMPRWASRITLEVTGVRVERLQDISEADAMAEGVTNSLHLQGGRFATENFAHLWWAIHGDGAWQQNPWVWVIEFNRVANDAKGVAQ